MKRFLSFVALILVLICVLASCSRGSNSNEVNNNQNGTQNGIQSGDQNGDQNGDQDNNNDDQPLPEHTHTFGEWSAVKAATCSSEGLSERSCSCGEKETKVIPTIAHSEVIDSAVDPTCTTTGLTEGKHCAVCNSIILSQNVVDAKGHVEVTDAAVDASCTKAGLTEGKHCSECGEIIVKQEYTNPLGHNPETILGRPSSCTETGVTDGRICSRCGITIIEQTVIPLSPHSYDDKYDESCNECGAIRDVECPHRETEILTGYAKTCTSSGLTDGEKCKKCGEMLVHQQIIPAEGHKEVVDGAIKATCTESGLTEGKHCSVCGEILITQTVIPARGHNEIVDKATEPTCTESGLTEGKHCSVCNEVLIAQETIDALQHKDVAVDAVCDRCSEHFIPTSPFKLRIIQNQLQYVLWWSKHGSTTQNADDIADIYVEAADGGFYLYTITEAKYYLVLEKISNTKEYRLRLRENKSLWTFDEEFGVFVTTISGTDYFLATINFSTSVRGYDLSLIKNDPSLIGVTYFPLMSVTLKDHVCSDFSIAFSSVTSPTCTSGGYTTTICTCGKESIINEVPALDYHIESDWIVDKKANANTNGKRHTECTMCGIVIKEEEILATGSLGLKYTLNEDGQSYTVSKGTCYEDNIYILAHYNGLPVTAISEQGFRYLTNLRTITIPDTITSVSKDSFRGCTNIRYNEYDNGYYIGNANNPYLALISAKDTSITSCMIHSDTKVVAARSFQYCSLLTEVSIPAGIKILPDYIFSDCASIENVSIPDSVESIGNSAFYNCKSLTNIEIPNRVTSIGANAFNDCSSLTSIVIPPSVSEVKLYSFGGCTSLKSVYITDLEAWCNIDYESTSSNPLTYKADLYLNNVLIKELVIPEQITEIKPYAFYACDSITSVKVSNAVSKIGEHAFYGCSSLEAVTIPNSVKDIDKAAFYKCTALKNISLSEGLTSIGDSAFWDCKSLTNVIIPDSVVTIGSYVFNNCELLESIIIPSNVESIGASTFSGCISLKEALFDKKNSKLETIEDGLFADCTSLVSITIPDSVSDISYRAFSGCSALEEVLLSDSVVNVGYNAFEDCSMIKYNQYDNALYLGSENNPYIVLIKATDISIPGCEIHPDTVLIYNHAFNYCYGLQEIVIPDKVLLIGSNAFDYSSVRYVTLGASVKEIGDYAFSITPIVSIVIGDSVERIGDNAFDYCMSLNSITFGNSLKYIGDCAFEDCRFLTSVVLPDSLVYLGTSAFASCWSLTSVVLPDSITDIGLGGTFHDCRGLKYVHIGSGITELECAQIPGNYYPFASHRGMFEGCSGLRTVSLASSVTSIGDYAFYGCRSLTTFIVPDQITEIGSYAFGECSDLMSITIGNSVTSIDTEAFVNCYSLIEVWNKSSLNIVAGNSSYGYVGYYAKNNITDQPESYLKTVGDYVFYDDGTQVYLVKYFGNESDLVLPEYDSEREYAIHQYAFDRCSGESIVIPDNVTSIGRNAFGRCNFLTSIVIPKSVTSIESDSFANSNSLEIYYFNGNYDQFDSRFDIGVYPIYCLDAQILSDGTVEYYSKGLEYTIVDGEATLSGIGTCEDTYVVIAPRYEGVLVTSIGDFVFKDNKNLNSVSIPKSVTYIGNGAFANCTAISNIEIPSFVKRIGFSAFWGCASLKSIVIPKQVSEIGINAFRDCFSIESIEVEKGNLNYCSIDGNLYTKDNETLIRYAVGKADETFVVPSGVRTIESHAFNGCDALVSVEIPNTVITIGEYAFYNCTSLTSVKLPSYLSVIEDSTFSGCISLNNVVIPNAVTSIGRYAFNKCTSLTNIVISGNVTSINEEAFTKCTALTDVYYTGSEEEWAALNVSAANINYANVHCNYTA